MKLNLLPQTVSKGRSVRMGFLASIPLVVLTVIACAAMHFGPKQALQAAEDQVNQNAPGAANAVATAEQVTGILPYANDYVRNTALAKAMIDHNDVYPDFYTDVKKYIPSFYRVTSMSASPNGADTCTLTLVGVLDSYQQYGDLLLAMMRWKDARDISRTGYVVDLPSVPAATPANPTGVAQTRAQSGLPRNQLDRLAYYQSQNYTPPGFQNFNNFGSAGSAVRGATPNESVVTIVMTVNRNLQCPDIAASLNSGPAGPAPISTSTSTPTANPNGGGAGGGAKGAGPRANAAAAQGGD